MSNNYNINIQEHLENQHAGFKAKFVKNIIYGGLDGIITTFSIIAASYGAVLSEKTIIALGVANLIADGISMGLGDYISSLLENNFILSEKQKEEHEYENNFEYEKQELVELFSEDGLNKDDSKKIVEILSKKENKNMFIKLMLLFELGYEIPDEDPKKQGLITFISFIIFGFIPVLFYIILYFSSVDYNNIFIVTCFISCVTMFILGYIQAIITKQERLQGGLFMLINGVIASGCAFSIGYGIEKGMN